MPGKQYETAAQNTLNSATINWSNYQNLIRPNFSFPHPKYSGIMVPTGESAQLHLLQVLTY